MVSGRKKGTKEKKKKKKKAGSPWRDSNSRPLVYKTSALTTELQRRRVVMMPSITVLLECVYSGITSILRPTVVSQARPFPFHSTDRFSIGRILKAIGTAEGKGFDLRD